MSLAEKVSEDVKSALKSGDKKKLAIARFLSSELKNFLIKENLDRELSKISDENFFKIVKTQVKQKKESLEFFEKAKHFKVPSGGEDLFCYEFSPENNNLVFLLHGWESNPGSLSKIAYSLSENNFRVISFDLPGHRGCLLYTSDAADE